MNQELVLIVIAIIFGLYASWNIGANDVSNAMGTSVGSKALTLRQAVIVAAIFEFSGAVFFGEYVSGTIQKGIVDPEVFSKEPLDFAYGMLSALFATGIWLQIATFLGFPVSTTHTIVGAIVGFGIISKGWQSIFWGELGLIASSWIISPFLGAVFAYVVFSILRKHIFYAASPLEATKRYLPWVSIVCSMIFLFIGLNSFLKSSANPAWFFISIVSISLCLGYATHLFLKNKQEVSAPVTVDHSLLDEVKKTEKQLDVLCNKTKGELHFLAKDLTSQLSNFKNALYSERTNSLSSQFTHIERAFAYLQIGSAALMAFSHGSNDVANAIGPVAAIFSLFSITSNILPVWTLVLGGIGIVLGLATWGWRVIETIGEKITELTPTRGFSAELSAACVILLASRLGFPISTTHTLVGAVLGVGLAGGLGSLNLRTIRDIFFSWIITIPAGAGLSILCYLGIQTCMQMFY